MWRRWFNICQKNGSHTFCKYCSFLLFRKSISHVVRCPSCSENEFWETIGFPCLACQFASITFRNPFQLWFKHQLQQWLNHNDSDSSEDEHYIVSKPRAHCLIQNEKDMLQYHNSAIELSLQEIKCKATPKQTCHIIKNYHVYKRAFKKVIPFKNKVMPHLSRAVLPNQIPRISTYMEKRVMCWKNYFMMNLMDQKK